MCSSIVQHGILRPPTATINNTEKYSARICVMNKFVCRKRIASVAEVSSDSGRTTYLGIEIA